MLPTHNRLRTADFKNFGGARTLHTPHFLLRVKIGTPRFGAAAVVSSAVAKRAAARNLLRRRVYAALERFGAQKCPPVFLAVMAKRGAAPLSFGDVRQELAPALQKIRDFR